MKYVALIIFISFIGLIAFSIPALNHRMIEPMDNCIGSKIDNTPCPANLVAATIHHISVYQAFFNTLPPTVYNTLLLLTLLVALTLVLGFLSGKNTLNTGLRFLRQQLINFELIIHKARQKFVSWLSLLEHSPSF